MRQAEKCLSSAREFGLDVQMFSATDKFEATQVAVELQLDQIGFDYVERQAPRPLRDAQLGCFLSHFRLWQWAVTHEESLVVLEHDAVVQAPLPRFDFPVLEVVVNLQDSIWNSPSWPYYQNVSMRLQDREPDQKWEASGTFRDSRYICLPGTCAYWISPSAAALLIKEAQRSGPLPSDLFINKSIVEIVDSVPFCVTPDHRKSTIAPNADWSGYAPQE